MPPRQRRGGFTVIEAVVATGLLATFVLAVTDTLIVAQRARAASEQRLLATEYAADGVEQLRVGQAPGLLDASLGLDRSVTVAPWEGHPGLVRIDVSVAWAGATPGRITLSTAVRR
jgi:hypothetical protein